MRLQTPPLRISEQHPDAMHRGAVAVSAGGGGGGGDGIAYLSTSGSDESAVVGFPETPFLTLQGAINALGAAGTVELLDNYTHSGGMNRPYDLVIQGGFDLTLGMLDSEVLDGLTIGTATCNINYPDYAGVGVANVGTVALADGCVLSYNINGAAGSSGSNGSPNDVYAGNGANGADAADNASDGSPGGNGESVLDPVVGENGGVGGTGYSARTITVIGDGSIAYGHMNGGVGGEGGSGGRAISQGGAGGSGGGGYWNGSEYETNGGGGGWGGDATDATAGNGGTGGTGGNGGMLYYAATVTPRDQLQYEAGFGGIGGAGGEAYSTGGGAGSGGSGLMPGGDGTAGNSGTATPGSAGSAGNPGNNGSAVEV